MRSTIKQAAEIVPAVTQDDQGHHLITICATPFMLRIEPPNDENAAPNVSIETMLMQDEGNAPAEQVSLLRTNHAMLPFWLTTLIVNWHGVRLHNALRDALNSEEPGVLRLENGNPVPLMTRSDATALYWRILADNPSAAEIANLRSQLAETVDSMKKISQWPWPIVGKEAQSLGDIRRFARENTPSPANDATPTA